MIWTTNLKFIIQTTLQLADHLAIGHVSTIRLPDTSGNQCLLYIYWHFTMMRLRYTLIGPLKGFFQSGFQTTIRIPDHLTIGHKSTIWIPDLSSIPMFTFIQSSIVNITLWFSSTVKRTLCLYCAPVSLFGPCERIDSITAYSIRRFRWNLPGHLLMGERFGGMRSEGQLSSEDCLTLKTCSLSNEEMVEISGQRLLVNVKDFTAEMHAQWAVRPSGRRSNKTG